MTKLCVAKLFVCDRWCVCVTKLCVKELCVKELCVTKLCVAKLCVCDRWCVCVLDGVCVCDKVVCDKDDV